MGDSEFADLMRQLEQLRNGVNCARRILELSERPEYGIDYERKAKAVSEVLRVAAARAEGDDSVAVGEETMLVMKVILADVEVRLLWDKLGLKTWRSK